MYWIIKTISIVIIYVIQLKLLYYSRARFIMLSIRDCSWKNSRLEINGKGFEGFLFSSHQKMMKPEIFYWYYWDYAPTIPSSASTILSYYKLTWWCILKTNKRENRDDSETLEKKAIYNLIRCCRLAEIKFLMANSYNQINPTI